MVKCVVSGCPNRRLSVTRGAFSRNRPPRRFFSFPEDPARVKVWLAALRETDRRDLTEEHLICEDHFLPEDISPRGVSADAIPLMPPCLDQGSISRWGGDSSEEEEEEEQQRRRRRPWAAAVKLPVVNPPQPVQLRPDPPDPPPTSVQVRGYEEKTADGLPSSSSSLRYRGDFSQTPTPPRPKPTAPLSPDEGAEETIEDKSTSERNEAAQTTKDKKPDVIVQVLTQGFLELLLTAPGGELDLRQAATKLDTSRQRVNDITNVLSSINLIKHQSKHTVQWTGSCPIRSFLWTNQDFENELEDMKLDEETLDALISGCSVELLQLTRDLDNRALAYVSHQDLRRLSVLREQTVMVVKAPEETTLKVSAPTEDRIQVHMNGAVGPIKVLTSDLGMGDVEVGERSSCFVTLEESRVTTATLHTEWPGLSAVQSITG